MARAEEPLVLRAGNGQFLRMNERGTLIADQLLPTDVASFARAPDQSGRLAMKNAAGRVVIVEGDAARHLWHVIPGDKPADRPVEVYRTSEIPATVRDGLAMVIRTLVVADISNREYVKTRKRKKREFVTLPAPTLRNLRRTKQHRVLAMDEEYELRAKLDGPPTIEIPRMPSLTDYDHAERGCLMFVICVRAPVRGEVRYKIPDALSASTGFRAEVGLELVGQVRSDRENGKPTLTAPEVLDLNVKIRSLDLSNDVLNTARESIEDVINDELDDRQDRIREQANKTIRKAVDAGEFRHPLLRALGVPEIK